MQERGAGRGGVERDTGGMQEGQGEGHIGVWKIAGGG